MARGFDGFEIDDFRESGFDSGRDGSEPSSCQARRPYSGTAVRDGVTAGKCAVLLVRLQFLNQDQLNHRFLKEERIRKCDG